MATTTSQWSWTIASDPDRVIIARPDARGRERVRTISCHDLANGRRGVSVLRGVRALEQHGGPIDQRTTIAVTMGGNTFGATRTGAVLVNALAWGRGARLVVDGRSVPSITPTYAHPPSIGPASPLGVDNDHGR